METAFISIAFTVSHFFVGAVLVWLTFKLFVSTGKQILAQDDLKEGIPHKSEVQIWWGMRFRFTALVLSYLAFAYYLSYETTYRYKNSVSEPNYALEQKLKAISEQEEFVPEAIPDPVKDWEEVKAKNRQENQEAKERFMNILKDEIKKEEQE